MLLILRSPEAFFFRLNQNFVWCVCIRGGVVWWLHYKLVAAKSPVITLHYIQDTIFGVSALLFDMFGSFVANLFIYLDLKKHIKLKLFIFWLPHYLPHVTVLSLKIIAITMHYGLTCHELIPNGGVSATNSRARYEVPTQAVS